MSLTIEHRDADELARRLADATGQSITDAVIEALRAQLKRETGGRIAPRLQAELRAISDRCAALPDYDKRTPEEIIGFDEYGIPT
jgi:antitoxin VapB